MTQVQGECTDNFAPMRAALSDELASGAELGASIAVTIDGEMVVDLWGGWSDLGATQPWTSDTITNVWSTTKTVMSLAALMLVERGELDVYSPVARYWPEFGTNGKADIEVRHLMSHTSGVSAWEQPVTTADIYDWEKSTAMLAAQPPWWKPGTASGYHALNQGHLVGEVVRRITGMPAPRGVFLRDEQDGAGHPGLRSGSPLRSCVFRRSGLTTTALRQVAAPALVASGTSTRRPVATS